MSNDTSAGFWLYELNKATPRINRATGKAMTPRVRKTWFQTEQEARRAQARTIRAARALGMDLHVSVGPVVLPRAAKSLPFGHLPAIARRLTA